MARAVNDKKVLKQFAQIELFIAVIMKVEKWPSYYKPDSSELEDWLKNYTNFEYHKHVTWKVFNRREKKPKEQEGWRALSKLNVFYDFVTCIRFSEEYVWAEKDFYTVIKFANKEDLLSKAKEYKTFFKPCTLPEQFEWSVENEFYVFFHDSFKIKEYDYQLINGVVQAHLEITSVVSIVLTLYDPTYDSFSIRVGTYKTIKGNGYEYFIAEFEHDEHDQKHHLQFRFDVMIKREGVANSVWFGEFTDFKNLDNSKRAIFWNYSGVHYKKTAFYSRDLTKHSFNAFPFLPLRYFFTNEEDVETAYEQTRNVYSIVSDNKINS